MLAQQTIERLFSLCLTGMAEAFSAQLRDTGYHDLSFEDRFGLLVEQEWLHRQNKRLARLLRQARLRLPACLEDIDYVTPRGLDRGLMKSLGTCQWIKEHLNILICGPTGVGNYAKLFVM